MDGLIKVPEGMRTQKKHKYRGLAIIDAIEIQPRLFMIIIRCALPIFSTLYGPQGDGYPSL